MMTSDIVAPYAKNHAVGLFQRELAAFDKAKSAGLIESAWHALERAHIISQPFLMMHLSSHWYMLRFAILLRDRREIAGQLLRLTLAPVGAVLGRIPLGNSGRSNVSAFKPMAIPDDLKQAMAFANEASIRIE
jgi:hypothetical protein